MKDAILFKDEGEGGPVSVRRGGVVTNYRDSELVSTISGGFYPRWFTRRQAMSIAEQEGLPFEEA